MEWQALGRVGVEVKLDLRAPLGVEQVDELKALYGQHHLLVFRGPELSREQQERALGYLAPVLHEDLPYVSNKSADAGLGTSEILFHSDFTWLDEPYLALSLHAVEATYGDSSTRFVDTAKVYASLPQSLKERIAPLHCIQSQPGAFAERRVAIDSPNLASAIHPLVRRDPATGLACLFVNPLDTIRVTELDPADSEDLLQELFGYLYRPENIHEHFWSEGDCLIWNNLVLQHGRGNVAGSPRVLQRASAGRRSFADQRPNVTETPYSARKADEERGSQRPGPATGKTETFMVRHDDLIMATNWGAFGPGMRIPDTMPLFNEPSLHGAAMFVYKIRNDKSEVIGFGAQQEEFLFDDDGNPTGSWKCSWTLTIPGRGSLFLYQIENSSRLNELIDLPADGTPWQGEATAQTTIGPRSDGRGEIVGGSGEFRGRTGSFVEIDHAYKMDLNMNAMPEINEELLVTYDD